MVDFMSKVSPEMMKQSKEEDVEISKVIFYITTDNKN